MNHHTSSQRILAMALSVVMALGMLPITAAAEALPVGISGEITAFEKLADAATIQTVALGTPFEDLDLPETLKATVRFETAAGETVQDSDESQQQEEGEPEQEELVQNSDESQQEEPEQNDNSEQSALAPAEEAEPSNKEESDAGYTEMTVSVPVTWTATPDYDGNAAGVYVFTAEISGFTVTAEPPTVIITVGQEAVKGTITAFDELTDDIRWQNTTIQADGTVGGHFADTSIWTIENGKLPILATIPVDVQDAALPPYLAGGGSFHFLGAGTYSDPYQIGTAAQLTKLAELVNAGDTNYNDKHYKLTAGISLSTYGRNWNSGKGWIPIGTDDVNGFKGSFDGNGKKITGLYINRTKDYIGLFGYLDGGMVQDLGLEEVGIAGAFYVGGVAGAAYGSVTNCYTTGAVNGGLGIGGVAGFVSG